MGEPSASVRGNIGADVAIHSSSPATGQGWSALHAFQAKSWHSRFVLTILFFAYLFSYIDRQIISLMVEPIKQDLGVTDFQISIIQGWAFSVSYAVMGIPIAVLADRSNRKAIIGIGINFWSLMTAVCGLAGSYASLFAARVGVGIGEAALSPAGASLLTDYFPARKLARAMAVFMLGVPIGAGLAYLIGGIVTHAVAGAGQVTVLNTVTLHPWQLTFIAVALPGFLIGALTFLVREPERKKSISGHVEENYDDIGHTAIGYLRKKWKVYLPFIFGMMLIFSMGFSFMAWYPTFLIRTYGLSIAEAGTYFGLIYIVFGAGGVMFGPWAVEKLLLRGYKDAHIRFIVIVAWVLLIPGILSPLVDGKILSLCLIAVIIFVKSTYLGVEKAALQLITPSRYRAQMMAILAFFAGMLGMGLGASVVAAFTDFVFRESSAVGYSIASASAIFLVGAIAMLTFCLGHYRREIEALRVFDDADLPSRT